MNALAWQSLINRQADDQDPLLIPLHYGENKVEDSFGARQIDSNQFQGPS